ncbi:hypothetical protein C8R44DRAFT_169226 [Mycena epipterygia]|nr:hypothetical protein C8R44DRAFT_169226 [Mycena epipterygia]
MEDGWTDACPSSIRYRGRRAGSARWMGWWSRRTTLPPATASSGTTKNGRRNSIPKPQHAGYSGTRMLIYLGPPSSSSAPISSCEHRVGLDLDPLRQAGWLMIASNAAPQDSSAKSGTRGALFSRPPPLDAVPAAILASFSVTPDMDPLLPAFFASTGMGDLAIWVYGSVVLVPESCDSARLRRPATRDGESCLFPPRSTATALAGSCWWGAVCGGKGGVCLCRVGTRAAMPCRLGRRQVGARGVGERWGAIR